MRAVQVVWDDPRVRPSRRRWTRDLWAVVVVCIILGLEIVAVMQTAGGPEAFRMMASEGFQQAQ